ncbi:MAG: DUF2190 family protein [Patescibacteria group bacterium]|nr:DUF2190 family protein [Patescibacteria group bacterium]
MVYNAGSPKIVVFQASGTILKGQALQLGTPTTQANPVPSLDISRPIPTVVACALSEPQSFIGIAMNAASSGEAVNVCIEGVCDGYVDASTDPTAGMRLSIAASAGELGEASTTTAQAVCMAVEAATTTADGVPLCAVYIPPHIIGIGI